MSSSDSIEASAATIDQAIGQALAQLGAEQDDVTIEVLSTPRSGVLGLGARPARVRVTRRMVAEARSGVMSPPPAPPLRPTPPEMRQPEARPQARVAPPYQERSEQPRPDLQDDHSQAAAPEAPREAPRNPPQSRREHNELPSEDRTDLAADERSDPQREQQTGAPREGRNGLLRQERSEGPRQRPRGQSRTAPPEPGRQSRSDQPRIDRGQPVGEHHEPSREKRSVPSARELYEVQASDRAEPARDDRATSDVDDRRDGARGEGRPRRGRRRGRGRGRGRTGGAAAEGIVGSASGSVEGELLPAETKPRQAAEPRDYEPGRDEESDPFASVDEAGNDPRQIADLQDQAREAAVFLQRILELMGEQATIESAESDDPETLELNIKGDGSGILIGRHGQTLDAIEYMVNRLLARKIKDAAPISIDTESYRARRRRLLQHMAMSKGEQAKREHVAVTVEPMPPRDRRIVHLALKDDPMIATRSTGDGFMRAIEIVPVAARPDPNERSNENRSRGRTREPDRDKTAIGEQGGFRHGQKRIV
jgi:spoIIIJ-associated protein